MLVAAAACRRTDEPRRSPAPSATAAQAAPASAAKPDPRIAIADSARIRGRASATVWIIEASDFQCPFCKMWHDSTLPALEREYIAPGKARLAFVNHPLSMHQNALPASEAAMCAGVQGKFWPYHDALFATQERWERMQDAMPVFDSLATAVGADAAALRSCISSHVMRPLIQADFERSANAGVNSTPSFLIGRARITGAQPIEAFRAVLDSALKATAKP